MDAPQSLHIRGRSCADGEPLELWTLDGVLTDEPQPGAVTVATDGWLMSGLVDAHNHVGIAPGLGVTIDQARGFAQADAKAGALLIREVGSPVDTHPLDGDDSCPEFIRSGHHIARPKRYLRGYGVELDDPADLPAEVRRQARSGDGWVKLVGDWIDREVGDLAPLWDDDLLVRAVAAAHEEGARITAHVFGTDALHGLVAAGVDCVEHGTGLTDDLIAAMADRSIALVPTLIQVDNFPAIADGADRFPVYQAHMRSLYANAAGVFTAAFEAGVPMYAGTDAGGFVEHGRIVDEVIAMSDLGLGSERALAAATDLPRQWLGAGTAQAGEPADLLVFADDPRTDLGVLRDPVAVIRAGRLL
ncbi:amidohydrolase family protein [Williamsia sterculiae]|uniref:Imidazolonepropionase n=1 Tax=Williamsia sterculiae TaxID=1344003 RepID=A0A1N7GIH7_9NOCA|nr:amidohydrolase family protein [Williamsia sterculiae]SIS12403.1 Imidazolonepropionase [Williamsia sterculiae]